MQMKESLIIIRESFSVHFMWMFVVVLVTSR